MTHCWFDIGNSFWHIQLFLNTHWYERIESNRCIHGCLTTCKNQHYTCSHLWDIANSLFWIIMVIPRHPLKMTEKFFNFCECLTISKRITSYLTSFLILSWLTILHHFEHTQTFLTTPTSNEWVKLLLPWVSNHMEIQLYTLSSLWDVVVQKLMHSDWSGVF